MTCQKKKAAIFLLLVTFACRHDGLRSGRSPSIGSELLAVPGAEQVRSGSINGFERLTYKLRKPYPAADVIFAISNHLRALGYKPMKNSWFNRDETSDYVRGWVHYVGVPAPGAKGHYICRWWADWRNAKGEIVSYALLYTSSGEILTNQDELSVSASKMSPAMAERLRAGVTANGPVLELPAQTPPNAQTATDNSPDPNVYTPRAPGGV